MHVYRIYAFTLHYTQVLLTVTENKCSKTHISQTASWTMQQVAQQLGRTSGYDPPRLLSLLHIAQWQALLAAGGRNNNYSMEAVAGSALRLPNLFITAACKPVWLVCPNMQTLAAQRTCIYVCSLLEASAACICAAGFAGHFVLAQLLPQNLKDYDVLLAAQLQNVSASDAATAQTIATNTATHLLQNRSACCLILQHVNALQSLPA